MSNSNLSHYLPKVLQLLEASPDAQDAMLFRETVSPSFGSDLQSGTLLAANATRAFVHEVLETERIIHFQGLARKIAILLGGAKAGSKIKSMLEGIVGDEAESELLCWDGSQDGWVWAKDHEREVTVTLRQTVAPLGGSDVAEIPPEVVGSALLFAAQLRGGESGCVETLFDDTKTLLRFRRMGKKIELILRKALASLSETRADFLADGEVYFFVSHAEAAK